MTIAASNIRRVGIALSFMAMVGASACRDTTAPLPPARAVAPSTIRLACAADIRARTLGCKSPAGGANSDIVVLGGQGTYIQLTSSNVAYNQVAKQFVADLSIQNLTGQQLGTADGSTVSGIDAFIASGPNGVGGTVSLEADGSGTFTGSMLPYMHYAEILDAFGGTSAPRTWTFDVADGVKSFTFTVLISAGIPDNSRPLRWLSERGFGAYSDNFVYGIDSRNVFAFGSRSDEGNDGTMITVDRFDGTGWHTINTDLCIQPLSAWGSSASDLLVGGSFGIVAHYDGTQWQCSNIDTGADVTAMWGSGPGDVYAISGPYLYHRAGSSWSSVSGGLPAATYTGIWGTAQNNVFVVGHDSLFAPIIAHFDGSAWTVMSQPGGAELLGLTSLFAAGDEAWAVGPGGSLHYASGAWRLVSDGTTSLLSVTGSSAANVVARVHFVAHDENFTSLARWDPVSQGWLPMATPELSFFQSIWTSGSNDVWAIGEQLSTDLSSIVDANPWHFDGSAWTAVGNNIGVEAATEALNAIFGVDASHLWAVGSAGQILNNTDHGWHQVGGQNHGISWNGVWASSNNDVWIVGDSGRVRHWGGASIDSVPMPSSIGSESIRSVFGFSSSDIWAGTDQGTLLHYDGTSWTVQSTDILLPTANAIWGPASNDIYAVGASGAVVHFDGTSWTDLPGMGDDLLGVRIPADDPSHHLLVIGKFGEALHDNGAGFDTEVTGTQTNLKTMFSLPSTGEIFAAGGLGTLLRRTSSGNWIDIPTGVSGEIRGMWADGASNVYLVGVGGFILHGSH